MRGRNSKRAGKAGPPSRPHQQAALRQPEAGHRGGLEPVAEREGSGAEMQHDAAHETLADEFLECAQPAEVRLTRRGRRSDFHADDVPGRIFDDDVHLLAVGAAEVEQPCASACPTELLLKFVDHERLEQGAERLLETFVVNELPVSYTHLTLP